MVPPFTPPAALAYIKYAVSQQFIYLWYANIRTMRGALIIPILLILIAPTSLAMSPIQPTITLTLSPETVNINSSADFKTTLIIDGNVKMDKPPFVRETVRLSSQVNTGWPTACTPDEMVITDESEHHFTCTVIIPEAIPNTTTTLKVRADSTGGGFKATGLADATIIVHGTASTNMTIDTQNETLPTNSTNPTINGWNLNPNSPYLMPGVILAVVAVAGSGTYVVYRRRTPRRRRPM